MQYERDGFIIVKGMLSEDECNKYCKRFHEICNLSTEEIRNLNFLVMRDIAIAKTEFKGSENSITKLQDWQDDPALFEFCKHPKIVEYARSFCGSNVKSIHTMFINKPPDVGTGTSRHPMHQDLHYFPMRPADRIVCAWAALEKINRDNGCLTVIPGSHRRYPLLPHDYPEWEGGVNKMYHGVKVDQSVLDGRIHVEMEKGDVVLFHPLLIHGSGTNRTKGYRKAISCHYASSDCYIVDIRGTSQQMIATEAAETYAKKIKAFFQAPANTALTADQSVQAYTASWSYKARLVSGREGTF
jgi:phytanoyl-CoA hydroxylase